MIGLIIGFYFLFWWCLAAFCLLLLVFGCYFILIFGVRRYTWGHKSVMWFDGFKDVRMLLNWGVIVQYLLCIILWCYRLVEKPKYWLVFVLLNAYLLKPIMVKGLAQRLFIWISNILAWSIYLEPNHKPNYVIFSGLRDFLFLSAAQSSFGLVLCDLGCEYMAQFWASKQAQLLISLGLYFSCCCRVTMKAQTWVLLYLVDGMPLIHKVSFELKDGIGSRLDQDAPNLVLICNSLVYLVIVSVWSYNLFVLGKHIIPTSRLKASRRCMFSELANTKACFGISLLGWRGYAPLNM